MAFSFNAIAFMVPILNTAELEIAGMLMARVVKNAILCPSCGVCYSLILPASASISEMGAATEELHGLVHRTCGAHPPIIQRG